MIHPLESQLPKLRHKLLRSWHKTRRRQETTTLRYLEQFRFPDWIMISIHFWELWGQSCFFSLWVNPLCAFACVSHSCWCLLSLVLMCWCCLWLSLRRVKIFRPITAPKAPHEGFQIIFSSTGRKQSFWWVKVQSNLSQTISDGSGWFRAQHDGWNVESPTTITNSALSSWMVFQPHVSHHGYWFYSFAAKKCLSNILYGIR